MVTRAQLVDAANELNTVLSLDPKIDLKMAVIELTASVHEAGELLRPGDDVSPETQAIVDALKAGTEPAEAEQEPEPEAEEEGEVVTKPRRTRGDTAAPATTPTRRGGGFRYEGSGAQKMDLALMRGGPISDLAEEAGVKKGMLRAHAKFRAKSGKWSMSEDGEYIQLTKLDAA